jgi:hypothetical protein
MCVREEFAPTNWPHWAARGRGGRESGHEKALTGGDRLSVKGWRAGLGRLGLARPKCDFLFF